MSEKIEKKYEKEMNSLGNYIDKKIVKEYVKNLKEENKIITTLFILSQSKLQKTKTSYEIATDLKEAIKTIKSRGVYL